jgi:hypothetical protein
MVAFEKMEAVRYANFMKPDGVCVINDYAAGHRQACPTPWASR